MKLEHAAQWSTSRRVRWSGGACLVVGCLLLAGCGGGVSTAQVSGRVTVGGDPVENVLVTFTPIGNGSQAGPGSTGRTDAEGRYRLSLVTGQSGAVVGKHRVTFAYRDDASFEMSEEDYAAAAARGELDKVQLPSEARDGSIEREVEPGRNDEMDFEF